YYYYFDLNWVDFRPFLFSSFSFLVFFSFPSLLFPSSDFLIYRCICLYLSLSYVLPLSISLLDSSFSFSFSFSLFLLLFLYRISLSSLSEITSNFELSDHILNSSLDRVLQYSSVKAV